MLHLLKEALLAWNRNNAARLGAAIAYYTVVSLAPLLVIAVAIGGAMFGEQAARGQVVEQFSTLIGEDGALAIQSILENSRDHAHRGLVASIVGVIVLLIGAAGVFVQLQDALNSIWRVQPDLEHALKDTLKKYFMSFAMVMGIGFLLLVSLLISAGVSALGKIAGNAMSSHLVAAELLNQLLSLVFITFLFAAMFRFVPDVVLEWRDVWLPAALTSVLFAVGKFVIGFYLGHSSIASAYGAAGSLVVILVWVYYSAQILLYGVEFTKVYKRQRGSRIVAEPHAERFVRKERKPDNRQAA